MQQDKPDAPSLFTNYLISNPEAFAANILKAFEKGSEMLSKLAERPDAKGGPYSTASELSAASENLTTLVRLWLSDPVRVSEAQSYFVSQFAALWNNVLMRMMGMPIAPLIEPASNDNRFKDPEWTHNPFFNFCKQAYLLACKWAEDQLKNTPGLEGRDRHRAEFYLRQMTSAYAPSNFMVTNPEVLRETFRTNAQNLVNGVTLLAEDMSRSKDLMKISQSDISAFELGRNLATTPGKVVFQNELLQLVQFSPTPEKVREPPIMMVPPRIQQYYIIHLTDH